MGKDVWVKEEHTAFANELADAARQVLIDHARENLGTSIKADNTLVTQLDILIEARLRDLIEKRYPDHGIIGEEQESSNASRSHVWVLDPIDGTASFVAGIPVFGTLIALAIDGVPQLGLIDVPSIDQRWLGSSGRQTCRNGQAVKVRSCNALSSALLLAGNRDRFSRDQTSPLDALRDASGARVYGGACLSYGRLAEGRADIVIDAGQSVYDFAPYRPIIEGAGGTITDWSGSPLTLQSVGNILASGDEAIHCKAVELLS